MTVCRGCGEPLRDVVLDLGEMPLANAFVRPGPEAGRLPTYPLEVQVCRACWLMQIHHDASPREIFSEYTYLSSMSETWVQAGKEFARAAVQDFRLSETSTVVEIASNDGYLLRSFKDLGTQVLGVEPAENVARRAIDAGIPTVVRFFGLETARDLSSDGVRADLLVANNVIAHVPDLHDLVAGIAAILAPAGLASIEFPHVLNLLIEGQFDTIYHEHFSYLGLLSLEPVLDRHGLAVVDVAELPTHGGSLRVLVGRQDSDHGSTPRVGSIRAKESRANLDRVEPYLELATKARRTKETLLSLLDRLRSRGARVVAYGAAAKGMTLLNYVGLGPAEIPYIADRSPEKQGRLAPGSSIPVVAPERIEEDRPDHVLILPWNLKEEIMGQLASVARWGGRFIVAMPEVQVSG